MVATAQPMPLPLCGGIAPAVLGDQGCIWCKQREGLLLGVLSVKRGFAGGVANAGTLGDRLCVVLSVFIMMADQPCGQPRQSDSWKSCVISHCWAR